MKQSNTTQTVFTPRYVKVVSDESDYPCAILYTDYNGNELVIDCLTQQGLVAQLLYLVNRLGLKIAVQGENGKLTELYLTNCAELPPNYKELVLHKLNEEN